MTTPNAGAYQAMLVELERDILPVEQKRNELITAINVIRAKAGLPPRPGGDGVSGHSLNADSPTPIGGAVSGIRSDAFVGKRLRSAAKDYLAMRRAQGLDGPATPREIYDAIMAGGFEFEGKDETNRLISLRNTLRKRTEVFKKFDSNGKYGLVEWYGPLIKKPKASADVGDDDDDDSGEAETATTKKVAAAT
jgi:hypothetical protein